MAELRKPMQGRITMTHQSRTSAYLSVDGKNVCTVIDLDYYEAILEAVEKKCSSCAKTGEKVG
jgi:hypothetical protein